MNFLKNLGLNFFYYLFRFLLSLRYRIEIKGLKEVVEAKKKGFLFLPNHPAEMDPLILIAALWKKTRPRPLVVEHFYYLKGLRFFMDLVGALPLPTMDVANKWKTREVEKLKGKILQELDRGENFLIYPSGKLKVTPDEKVGGASMIPDLIAKNPELSIVLVRTTGLWGSMFSRALTGGRPDFAKCLWKGCKILLKNGIFFAPRRKVLVEFAVPPADFPKTGDKLTINRWLEEWYNRNGPEPLHLVSYAFWKKELPEVIHEKVEKIEEIPVPNEIRDELLAILSKMTRYPQEKLESSLQLSNDLGLDSLDIGLLRVHLEERYDVTGLAPGQLQTVGDFLQAAVGVKKENGEIFPAKKSKWPREGLRPTLQIGAGETIAEVFLRNCDEMGPLTACMDSLTGALSYKKLKRAALVLSEKVREMPGDKIGILLPSSVAAYVVILAVMLSGKTPVMLNWTAGPRSLNHSAEVCDLQIVLSSYRFLSRLDNGDFGDVHDKLVLLEEIRRHITFFEKLKGVYLTWLPAESLMKKLALPKDEEDTAVIIFTSGTESLPKGVPLSHKNILTNQKAALSCVSLGPEDILYGVLPPFHSFGFSVTGLLPLLAGLKVCFAPDPTDSRSLANDIEHYRPTLFCCAPSFISALWRVAKKEQLQSLKLVVTGAEKAPKELIEAVQRDKEFMEGYGISECSPIVTLERKGDPKTGVGKPLPGVSLTILEPDEKGEGEVCIRGPSVFHGYLGEAKDPFITLDGERWYRSGDRGRIDPDGTLILTGRLKRFVKLGGEMVSLGGLEEDIGKICREKRWLKKEPEGPFLAVIARGRESEKPEIVLYATLPLDREELNRALREMGASRLVKIASIENVKEIPLTGTGKTHYRMLDDKAFS